jgi:hypothetical protein
MNLRDVAIWGTVAGATLVGANQLGFFETPKCGLDGDGRVFRLVDDHTLAHFGQLGRGAHLSEDGKTIMVVDEVCEVVPGLVDHAGKPMPGYKLRQR